MLCTAGYGGSQYLPGGALVALVVAVCGGAVVVAVVEFVPMVIGYMVPSFHWIRFNDQT